MGAWVVFDPYWDPLWAYADEAEARDACGPSGAHPGAHALWVTDVTAGDCSEYQSVSKPWDD
jgi:hypothetical protein